LLAFLLCQAALNVHAATHASSDSTKCEICASFSDSPVVNVIDDIALEGARGSIQFRDLPLSSSNDRLRLTPPVRGPPGFF
jgi:hypothetical protein